MRALLRPSLVAVSLALAAVACGGADATEDADANEGAIEGGELDRDALPVGVLDVGEATKCTGTLVAPNVVLTSAHCFKAPAPDTFRLVAYGGGDFAVRIPYAIVDTRIVPGAVEQSGLCPKSVPDVALVKLDKDVLGVTPMKVSYATPRVGAECSVTGFGLHFDERGAATVGHRRTAKERVVEVTSAAIRLEYVTGQSNRGDSGGPLVCSGAIVGTSSCAPKDSSGRTVRGQDHYSRLGAARAFVEAALREWSAH